MLPDGRPYNPLPAALCPVPAGATLPPAVLLTSSISSLLAPPFLILLSLSQASVSVCSESRPCLLLSWCQKCPSKAMELPVRGRTRARWLHRLDLAPSTELSSP